MIANCKTTMTDRTDLVADCRSPDQIPPVPPVETRGRCGRCHVNRKKSAKHRHNPSVPEFHRQLDCESLQALCSGKVIRGTRASSEPDPPIAIRWTRTLRAWLRRSEPPPRPCITPTVPTNVKVLSPRMINLARPDFKVQYVFGTPEFYSQQLP